MRTLSHMSLSPACRQVRLVLAEKGLETSLREVAPVRGLVPAVGDLPTSDMRDMLPELIDEDGTTIVHAPVICDYLEETYPARSLLGPDAVSRAEARTLTYWFERKFTAEVTDNLLGEKLMKRLLGTGEPNVAAIRYGLIRINAYMAFLSRLAEERRWLAGNWFSLADLAAAAQLSALDYLDNVPWEDWPHVKDWYARVKSRPSFRPLLADRIPGLNPPAHYADLDF